MGKLVNIINFLHKKTKRQYLPRMQDDKVHCMEVAREYGSDYWDGDRRYGYGGYSYDGRWKALAQRIIETYQLPDDARILDVGCGKAFLLYELAQLLPGSEVSGFDISEHGIGDAKKEVADRLFIHRAEEIYPFEAGSFDLVLSINTLHNLPISKLKIALQEIERVGRNKLICVESFRSELELFNLQCWALTCESFYSPEEWVWICKEFGYSGDYEFIYFE